MLKLDRPIIFFDLETTGLDRENDRIVQIALTKLNSDWSVEPTHSYYLNPGIPIPEATTDIHGITDETVRHAPGFAEMAGVFYEYFVGCDVGGFNSNYFDVPFLYNEFVRAGYHWDYRAFRMIDVGNLFKIKEPRNLANAVRFYCNFDMTQAHDAAHDTEATVQVFLSQLQQYSDLPATVDELAIYTNYGCKMADLSGKFIYDQNGVLRFNFGKYKGQPASNHLDFVTWMYYKASFAPDTNEICASLLEPDTLIEEGEEGSDLPF